MRTRINKTINHALLIKEEHLQELFELIKAYYANIKVEAECIDDTYLTFGDINEIFDFRNKNNNQIIKILINADNAPNMRSFDDSFELEMSSKYRLENANFKIYSISYKDCQFLTSEIEKIFIQMRPWYHLFAKINFFYVLFVTVLCVVVIYSVYFSFFPTPSTISIPLKRFWTIHALFYLFILINFPPFSLWKLIHRFYKYIFPVVFFLIGDQKEEYTKIEKMRHKIFDIIVISIATSFVVGIIVNIVSSYFLK